MFILWNILVAGYFYRIFSYKAHCAIHNAYNIIYTEPTMKA